MHGHATDQLVCEVCDSANHPLASRKQVALEPLGLELLKEFFSSKAHPEVRRPAPRCGGGRSCNDSLSLFCGARIERTDDVLG